MSQGVETSCRDRIKYRSHVNCVWALTDQPSSTSLRPLFGSRYHRLCLFLCLHSTTFRALISLRISPPFLISPRISFVLVFLAVRDDTTHEWVSQSKFNVMWIDLIKCTLTLLDYAYFSSPFAIFILDEIRTRKKLKKSSGSSHTRQKGIKMLNGNKFKIIHPTVSYLWYRLAFQF